MRRIMIFTVLPVLAFGAGLFAGQGAQAQRPDRILELRTYTANEGKLPALIKQFRDQQPLFEKYNMPVTFYAVGAEEPRSGDTLMYLVVHESREAARESWAGFLADPGFAAARAEADAGGRAAARVESIFLNPTDYSLLR